MLLPGGKLLADDTVRSWLPGAVSDERAITIQMLLAHTSGVFNAGDEGDIATDIGRISDPTLRQQAQDLGERYLAGEAVIAAAEVLIALADTHSLYFAPGTGHHYSNVNYQLLAMVLEEATGEDFATLLEERLTGPLRLSSTTTAPADLRLPDLRATRRTRTPASWSTPPRISWAWATAGAAVSSPPPGSCSTCCRP